MNLCAGLAAGALICLLQGDGCGIIHGNYGAVVYTVLQCCVVDFFVDI